MDMVLAMLLNAHSTIRPNGLEDTFVYAPLAYGTAHVRTIVVPGHELALNQEHTNLDTIAGNDLPSTLDEFI
jgi:hypothetical protein